MKEKAFQRTVKILFVVCAVLFGGYYGMHIYQMRYTSSPVIDLPDTPLVISCSDGTDVLLRDVAVSDQEDGDLTDRLILESVSSFDQNMQRTVTYAAADSDGHVSKKTRKLSYSDYHEPRYTLDTMLRFTSLDLNAVLEHLHVTDLLDGDLSHQIKIDSFTVDGMVNGTCELALSTANSAGDMAQMKLRMSLVASSSGMPTVYLSDYIIYIKQGAVFDAKSYVHEVLSGTVGETLTREDVAIDNPVDSAVPGTYIVTYTAKNSGGISGSAFLSVVVEP